MSVIIECDRCTRPFETDELLLEGPTGLEIRVSVNAVLLPVWGGMVVITEWCDPCKLEFGVPAADWSKVGEMVPEEVRAR